MRWVRRAPLIVFAVTLMAGMLVAVSYQRASAAVEVVFVISILIFIFTLRKENIFKYICGAFSFFLLGILIASPLLDKNIAKDHIKNFLNYESRSPLKVEGMVVGTPEYRHGRTRLYVDVDTLLEGELSRPVSGRVQLTVRGRLDGEGGGDIIMRGDRISFSSRLKGARNFANPGGFDYEWWLKRKGVLVRGYVRDGTLKKLSDGSGVRRHIDGLRARVGGFIKSADVNNLGMIKALSIGEKGEILLEKKESFTEAGTSHLLAISGLHVGFVACIFYVGIYWLLRRSETLMLAVDVKKFAMGAALLPVFIYGLMSGGSVSTQRAVIMVTAVVLALLLNKIKDVYNTIALAAIVVLIVAPSALWDVGFQLSFMAVLTIVYMVPVLNDIVRRSDKDGTLKARGFLYKARTLFFVSAAAIVGTAPILALHFNRVSLVAFISNSIVVPLVGFIAVPLVLFSAAISFIWEGFATFTLRLADVSLSVALTLVEFFAALPYSSVWVATPTVFEVVLYYIIVVLLLAVVKGGRYRGYTAVVLVFAVLVLIVDIGLSRYRVNHRSDMAVTFLDVGQGDSTLVEFPDSEGRTVRMLIDGGGFYGATFDTGRDIIAPYLWSRGIKKIEYVLLSHPQRDHAKGLRFIVENFGVKEFIWSGGGELDEELSAILKDRGVAVREVNSKSEPLVAGMATLSVLAPSLEVLSLAGDKDFDVNEASLVVRLDYGERSLLFTGDIGGRAEAALLAGYKGNPDILDVDIVKVPHHGSRYSSTERFIDALSPMAAVVSLGGSNIFGFPHPDTVGRYDEAGVRLYRTDIDGAVTVVTDGDVITIKGYLTGATQ